MSTSSTEGDTAEAAGDKPTRHRCHTRGAISAAGNRGPELQHVRETASMAVQALTAPEQGGWVLHPVATGPWCPQIEAGCHAWGCACEAVEKAPYTVSLSVLQPRPFSTQCRAVWEASDYMVQQLLSAF